MISSVARDSGRSVQAVGADSYALTLWAFLHGKDAQHLDGLTAEYERLELAEAVTRGFVGGTTEIEKLRKVWRQKLGGTNAQKSNEDVIRIAREMFEKTIAPNNPTS